MNNLIPSYRDTLFGLVTDISIDIAETMIDSVLKDDLLKDIPVIGMIISLCKVGACIREKNLLAQTITFINSFNNGSIDPEILRSHREELENNPKKAERELGRIILLLDSHTDLIKSKILGRFYRAYIRGLITWEKFSELAKANKQLFITDYKILIGLNSKKIDINDKVSEDREYKLLRLMSLGLVFERRARLIGANKLEYHECRFETTPFGRTFVQNMR
jgi:hypothetical protein